MAGVEREIDHLWRDSMKADDSAMSQRLAEVSHTLDRAARLLEHNSTRSARRPPRTARLMSRNAWPKTRAGSSRRGARWSDRPRIRGTELK